MVQSPETPKMNSVAAVTSALRLKACPVTIGREMLFWDEGRGGSEALAPPLLATPLVVKHSSLVGGALVRREGWGTRIAGSGRAGNILTS